MSKITFSVTASKAFMLALCLIALLALGACGKKATRLDPPEPYDRKHDPFPATYPDPSTDPAP